MLIPGNNEHLIEKHGGIAPELTYAALRERAIELVQQYSGNTWTDFNIHDPGVTILEYLCFAFSDLAYRTNFSIEDLLANEEGLIDRKRNSFFTRKQILTTNPVTTDDYRKLIIDKVDGISNVWIEPVASSAKMPYTKGLYRVLVQFNMNELEDYNTRTEKGKANRENEVCSGVKKLLLQNRNIGEDFEEPELLRACEIDVKADIVIDRSEIPEEILAEIYAVLHKTLNPELKFYSENEMIQKKFSPENIYNGPPLDNGFILDEDLKRERPLEIDTADLVKVIVEIKGVLLVRSLFLFVNGTQIVNKNYKLDKSEFPFINLKNKEPLINLFIENDKIPVKQSLFKSLLMKKEHYKGVRYAIKQDKNAGEFMKRGNYRDVQNYFSIQNLFPAIYNLYEIPPDVRRKIQLNDKAGNAKAKQLKAYLMIFEQVIANYLSQLANVDLVLSAPGNQPNPKTYFSQPLYNIPDVAKILAAFSMPDDYRFSMEWEKFKRNMENSYRKFLNTEMESEDVYYDRKTRVINHMLARFNYHPNKYPVELYVRLYGWKNSNDEKNAILQWKAALLNDLPSLTQNRNQGFDYYEQSWESESARGGFEEKMNRLLFIKNPLNRYLSDVFNSDQSSIHAKPSSKSDNKSGEPGNWYADIDGDDDDKVALYEPVPLSNVTQEKGEGDSAGDYSLFFERTSIHFFKDGLVKNRLKIIADPNSDKGQWLVIQKLNNPNYWKIAGRYADKKIAGKVLNDFTRKLKGINIQSEGFHLVEHVLLRPLLNSSFFGFNIVLADNCIIAKQKDWCSFYEREKTLKKIGEITEAEKLVPADEKDMNHYKKLIAKLEGLCLINRDIENEGKEFIRPSGLIYNGERDEEKNLKAKRILNLFCINFQRIVQNNHLPYPAIQTVVRLSDGKEEIREIFFDSRVTVVLPSWTARFQNRSFRTFTEKLFIEHSPVVVKLNFKWLSINEMKAFEESYFKWIHSMKNQDAESVKDTRSLILNLYDEKLYS